MSARAALASFLTVILPAISAHAQETTLYRVVGVTFNTLGPTQLSMSRGRLIWRDTDANSGMFLFKFYTGGEILTLDSNLVGLTAAIQGDFIVWNTAGELVKSFDLRSWRTSQLGLSYNPDGSQPVSLSNNLVAYAQRSAGTGTRIVLHNFTASTDTLLSAGTWNRSPSADQGEVAWVASDSELSTASSNIFLFDGTLTRNISGSTGLRNSLPRLRDGRILWLQSDGVRSWVNFYTGDTVMTLAHPQNPQTLVTGFDLSDGVAVAAMQDTVAHTGVVRIFALETGEFTDVADTNGPSNPSIDNGLLSWQSGAGLNRSVMIYAFGTGLKATYGGGEKPVVGGDLVAWTSGDAIELYSPATYQQLTSDAMNGWEQTKFKTIDSARAVYGNYANSVNMRVFSWDGMHSTPLRDSSQATDFLMANDGYVIWRVEADSLFYYDGTHAPVKFLDTVQAENPVVAGGSVGFGGKRTTVANDTARIWLYEIGKAKLTMIAVENGFSGRVLPERNTACWRSAGTGELMFFDGTTIQALGDSMVANDYSYRNGKVVWIDRRNGQWEIKMYDTEAKNKIVVLADSTPKANPITDGSSVLWYENPRQTVTTVSGDIVYCDLTSLHSWHVGHGTYRTIAWNSMSNGKIAWTPDGNSVVACDGRTVTELMPYDGFRTYSGVYLDHDRVIWSRAIGSSTGSNGDITVQTLRPHVGFQADRIKGPLPLTVSFSNQSWEGDETCTWDFGDGASSTEKSPVHTYTTPGVYTVNLTVTGRTGSMNERKYRFIRAASPTVDVQNGPALPLRMELQQNYPNPFNPTTTIGYFLPRQANIRLEVFNILGERVTTLVKGNVGPGSHVVVFDASHLASGVYLYRLAAGSFVSTKKLLVIR